MYLEGNFTSYFNIKIITQKRTLSNYCEWILLLFKDIFVSGFLRPSSEAIPLKK
jgi:hypothetical protein